MRRKPSSHQAAHVPLATLQTIEATSAVSVASSEAGVGADVAEAGETRAVIEVGRVSGITEIAEMTVALLSSAVIGARTGNGGSERISGETEAADQLHQELGLLTLCRPMLERVSRLRR